MLAEKHPVVLCTVLSIIFMAVHVHAARGTVSG
jgi:hypothetical protein